MELLKDLNEEKVWSKGFTTIVAAHSMNAVGNYMLMPIIPLFLVSLGAVESQVGIISTAVSISAILTRFLISAVVEKLGKKRIIIIGLLISTIMMVLYSLVESLGVITLLRVIQGMGGGMVSTIAATMAADMLPDSRRGQGVGYFSMGVVAAMTIAPAIALFVREKTGFPQVFLVAACFALVSALLVFFFIEEPRIPKTQPQEKGGEKRKSFEWRNMFDRKLVVSSVIVMLFGICRCVDLNYIAIFAEERNMKYLSFYFMIQTVTMFCIRFVVGRFADRKGRNWVLIPGGFATLAYLFTMIFAHTDAIMLFGSFLSGLGIGVLAPNLQVWMLNTVAPEKRNAANSSFYGSMDIGNAVGASLMGFTAQHFGFTIMFGVGACVALLHTVGYIAFGREKKARV